MDNNKRNNIPSSPSPSSPPTPKTKSPTPIEFLDSHHHFYDTQNNDFHSFLKRFNPTGVYLPSDYHRDVIQSIHESKSPSLRAAGGIRHIGSIHVESMPDSGLSELLWVSSLPSTVLAIVASCNLASPTASTTLRSLLTSSPRIRGVRWILDHTGDPTNPANHPGTLRHPPSHPDYLRNGPSDTVTPEFERGFALLAQHGLSFDLQCAPQQLPAAAKLCARHPGVRVVIDHLGKPMRVLGEDNGEMMPLEEVLEEWRVGMRGMAALPQCYVKISMLGWVVPNWTGVGRRVDLVGRLCRETVEMFGAERCMVATNWFGDAVMADSDGLGEVGPKADELMEYMLGFFAELSLEERRMIFSGTAKKFYRID